MTQFDLFITEDVITVIILFLPLDDRLKFIRINKTFSRAIQSFQNMWKNDVLLGFLHIHDQSMMGIEKLLSEYRKFNNNCDDDEINWMKVVQFQYLKLPRKIAVERKDLYKTLDGGNYGNVDLVNCWKSPFMEQNIEPVKESSIFEFTFDIRNELDRLSDLDSKKERMKKIYWCCFFYELLSMGDYVPNLFTDLVKIIPTFSDEEIDLSNFEMKESFVSILLAILDDDLGDQLHKYFSNKFQTLIHPNSVIYEKGPNGNIESKEFTPEMIMERGIEDFDICPNIPVTQWLSLNDFKFTIKNLTIADDLSAYWDSYCIDPLFSLYYNAGGAYNYDILKVSFNIDETDGRKIKLTRIETEEFY